MRIPKNSKILMSDDDIRECISVHLNCDRLLDRMWARIRLDRYKNFSPDMQDKIYDSLYHDLWKRAIAMRDSYVLAKKPKEVDAKE